MELIAILLGELLIAPVLAAMFVAVELCGIVLALLARLVLGIHSNRNRRQESGDRDPQQGPRHRWLRPVTLVLTGLVALSMAFLLVLELFFFSDTLRWSLDKVEAKTGIAVRYDSAEGSLFDGSLTLTNVAIDRPDGDRTSYDVDLERLELDLRVTSLLGSAVVFDSLLAHGVRGEITWPDTDRPEPKAKKRFRIDQLAISDLSLTLHDQKKTKKSYDLVVDYWRSDHFRSGWIAFDTLLNSTVNGTLAGSEFEVRRDRIDGGSHSIWRATNLPIWYLASKLGGRFAKLKLGSADIFVDFRWTRDTTTEIESNWRVTLKAIRAKNPLVRAAVKKLGSKTLEFQLKLDGGGLATETSSDSGGFFKAVGKAMIKKLLGR